MKKPISIEAALMRFYRAKTKPYSEIRAAHRMAGEALREAGLILDDLARFKWMGRVRSLEEILSTYSPARHSYTELQSLLLALPTGDSVLIQSRSSKRRYVCKRLEDRVRKKKAKVK